MYHLKLFGSSISKHSCKYNKTCRYRQLFLITDALNRLDRVCQLGESGVEGEAPEARFGAGGAQEVGAADAGDPDGFSRAARGKEHYLVAHGGGYSCLLE